MLFRRSLLIVFMVWLCMIPATVALAAEGSSPAATGSCWPPSKTWVFSVGVLKWKNKDLSGFTKKDRRDEAIVNSFRARGVPPEHIVYLADKQATLEAIKSELAALLKKTQPGDSLFFYYCGHGWISAEDEKTGIYANYDAGNTDDTCWSTASIAEDLADDFNGSTVICAVDCCHSGSLANAMKAAKPKFDYGVLTSALDSENSTGNWTFSQSVLDCLAGHRYADNNNDNVTTFAELGQYVQAEMKKFEKQNATVASNPSFDRSFLMGKNEFPGEITPERVEVLYEKDWWPARLMETRASQARVRWVSIGFDSASADEWVDLKDVRFLDR